MTAALGTDAVVWRLASAPVAAPFRFDDSVVVFNPASWDTHLLNESAALILELLTKKPRSLQELVEALAGDRAPSAELDRFRQDVRFALENMESLGLVKHDAGK